MTRGVRVVRAREPKRKTAMKALSALLVLLGSTPAAMAGSFKPPEGCEVYLTVQSKQCRVSNHYRCAADPAGDQWRADFDQEGLFFQSRINSEAEWVESYDSNPPVKQVLEPNPTDPASFSELLSRGVDSYAFGLSNDLGERTKVRGQDRLTGKAWVIDGVTLQETEYTYTETDLAGNILRQSRGKEYISPEWRMFFAGPSEWNGGDGNFLPIDGSPVEFIFPGEPGFASTQPIFDCDAVMSQLDVLPQAKEAPSHDHL
jgi:hypothetical protein